MVEKSIIKHIIAGSFGRILGNPMGVLTTKLPHSIALINGLIRFQKVRTQLNLMGMGLSMVYGALMQVQPRMVPIEMK